MHQIITLTLLVLVFILLLSPFVIAAYAIYIELAAQRERKKFLKQFEAEYSLGMKGKDED